jgi:hypothetical protein
MTNEAEPALTLLTTVGRSMPNRFRCTMHPRHMVGTAADPFSPHTILGNQSSQFRELSDNGKLPVNVTRYGYDAERPQTINQKTVPCSVPGACEAEAERPNLGGILCGNIRAVRWVLALAS